ncbi:hypothetical protein SDC9_99747 [bioreactor metagenome]|uniref:N-acetylmuramoyl-L-alanine amidase LytC n=1 Tax=bioreactor metagenome TaxID=1076179 RepID=A0A645AQ54_9ZZZZ
MPILLVSSKQGTSVVDDFIKGKNIKASYIIGGENAISNETLNKLPKAKRIGGKDRNETNSMIVENFYTSKTLNNIFVCKNGMKKQDDLIDALSVGVLASKENSPVVIVNNNLDNSQKQVLKYKQPKTIVQVGGGCENAFKELKDLY